MMKVVLPEPQSMHFLAFNRKLVEKSLLKAFNLYDLFDFGKFWVKRSMSLGAKSIWSCTRSLERIGRGCTGMRATPRNLVKITQITSLLKMMMKIFPLTGLHNPLVALRLWCYKVKQDPNFFCFLIGLQFSGVGHSIPNERRYNFCWARFIFCIGPWYGSDSCFTVVRCFSNSRDCSL